MLGPNFNENLHPKAIYTNRSLSSLTSNSSMISFNTKQSWYKISFIYIILTFNTNDNLFFY